MVRETVDINLTKDITLEISGYYSRCKWGESDEQPEPASFEIISVIYEKTDITKVLEELSFPNKEREEIFPYLENKCLEKLIDR